MRGSTLFSPDSREIHTNPRIVGVMHSATNADPSHDPPPDRSAGHARPTARRPPSPGAHPGRPRRATDLPTPSPRLPGRRRWVRTGVAVLGVTALSMGAGAVGAGLVVDRGSDQGSDSVAIESVGVDATPNELSVAEIVDGLADSVVSIETTVSFRRGPFEAEATGAGTGVVLDNGYIVTNAHVVDGATEVEVTVPGTGATLLAEIVGADPANDIAVLHVDDTSGLVPASLASPEQAAVGDSVVAIGNALALEGGLTVTQGIVSALDRSVETEGRHARRPDPDRRRDQLRQLGRSAGQRPR